MRTALHSFLFLSALFCLASLFVPTSAPAQLTGNESAASAIRATPIQTKPSVPAAKPEADMAPSTDTTNSSESAAASPEPGANLPRNIGTRPDPDADKVKAITAQVLRVVPEERHFRSFLAEVVAEAYRQRGYRPLWEKSALTPDFSRNLSISVSKHAYPERVTLKADELVAAITDTTIEAVDLAHTIAFCDASLLVRIGAVPTEKIWPEWNKDDTPGSDDWSLDAIVGNLVVAASVQPFDMERAIETMAPKNWMYRELVKEYPTAKDAILKYSGLPQIPDPETAGVGRPGEAFPYAPAVAAHLADRGYLKLPPEQIQTLSSMTPELVAALTAFQNDYGLEADGIFGSGSWQCMNTNAADRYRSITINIHRARLLPDKLGERYVVVNLPSAEAFLFEANDFHVKSMRVVHGDASKDTHHTPIFRDTMQEVVFGPYWNVPPSIAKKEILPKAQADWGFLSRNRYEIVSSFNPYNKDSHRLSPENLELVSQGRLLLRQKPGPSNALGRIKFLFPNKYNVYMHDPPAKSFFARSKRDHSHGCIRVSQPEELGAWVLGAQGWTGEQVKTAMFADDRKSQMLEKKVNVYVTYFTTFPRPIVGGRIVLAPARDVYELDPVDSRTLAAVIPWNEPDESTTPLGVR